MNGLRLRTRAVAALAASMGASLGSLDAHAAPPVNDECAGAIAIGSGLVAYDNTEATDSISPPPCLSIAKDVWFAYTAEASGTLTVTSCGQEPAGYDSVIAIYAGGSCGGLVQLSCNDAGGSCGFDEASTSAAVAAGQTYWIRFGSFGSVPGQMGGFLVSFLPPPANDTCAAAAPLTLDVPVSGWTLVAANDYQVLGTFAGIGQASPGNAIGRDVVYAFTAPAEGSYSFRVTGYSAGNPVLYIAERCPVGPPPQNVAFIAGANRTTSGTFAGEEVACVAMDSGQQVFVFVDETSATGSHFTIEVSACVPELEPNGAPGSASALAFGSEGSISPAGDVDFLSLGTVAANSRIFAIIDGIAAASSDFDLRATTSTDTLEYDDSNNAPAWGSLSPNIAGTPAPPADTNLFLRVSHFSAASQAEPWRLHAVVQPPMDVAVAALEPDDQPHQANYAAGGYFLGALASASDVDHFVFTALAGQLVYLGLDGDPLRDATPINGALALLDADGEVLVVANDAGSTSNPAMTSGNLAATTPTAPGEGLLFRVAATGTYMARVSASAPGDYLLSIAAMPAAELTYCAADAASCESGGGAYIAGVAIEAIASASGPEPGCYSSFTDGTSATLLRTAGAGIEVTSGNPIEGDVCTVWCDWNLDGDFEDIGEEFGLSGGPATFSGTIVPPASALLGASRMRVRLSNAFIDPVVSPCGTVEVGEVEDYALLVAPAPPVPPNDGCADATPIGNGTFGGSTANATGDGTASCDPGGGRDVWYAYAASTAGLLEIDTCGSAIDTILSVHDACDGAELACSDDCDGTPCGGGSCLSLPVSAGQQVLIRVAGKGGEVGAFTLGASLGLLNDQCSGAILVAVPSSTPGTTVGATIDTGLPDCGPVSPSPGNHSGNVGYSAGGVWYRLVGDGRTVTVDTLVSSYDTRLHVFTGRCGSLSCVTANDDISTGFKSKVAFQTIESEEYFILVSGFSTATGTFTLDVAAADTPGNDDCADAFALGIAGTIEGTTAGATGEGFVPNSNVLATCATNTADPLFDVWYAWTAPCSATLTLSTCGVYDTLLSVHAPCPGLTVGNQVAGACSDDGAVGCAPGSQLAFAATEGVTYFIRVAGAAGIEPGGAFTLAWSLPDADEDDTPDCLDGCPEDPSKIAPGECGCGVSDVDSDDDGTPDCLDACASDPAKTAPGICGCGVSDIDSDGDGTADCNDGCPSDPMKLQPGQCGCGASDLDSDGDATSDCVDGCPGDPDKVAPGACGCGVADADSDRDGSPDCLDGCPTDPAKLDPGICGCGVSDMDTDEDGAADCDDGCATDPDKLDPGICGCGVPDVDGDGDGSADCIDECPDDPGKVDPGVCGCGTPDTDTDVDGIADCVDECPGYDDTLDCNANGVPDGCDLLEGSSDDQNRNGVPDECECLADLDDSGVVDGADLGLVLAAWNQAGAQPADLNLDGIVNGADLGLVLAAWGACPG